MVVELAGVSTINYLTAALMLMVFAINIFTSTIFSSLPIIHASDDEDNNIHTLKALLPILSVEKDWIESVIQTAALCLTGKRYYECYQILGAKGLVRELASTVPFIIPFVLLMYFNSPIILYNALQQFDLFTIPVIAAVILTVSAYLTDMATRMFASRRMFEECKEIIGISQPIVTSAEENKTKWKLLRICSRVSYSIFNAMVYYNINSSLPVIILNGLSAFVMSAYPEAAKFSSQPFILFPPPRPQIDVEEKQDIARDHVIEMSA